MIRHSLILLTSFLAIGLVALASAGPAFAFQLKPHKDRLFAYPKVLERSADGSFMRVDYNRERDIVQRDTVPLAQVKPQYTSGIMFWARKVRRYKSPNGTFRTMVVGKQSGANIIVIFVHGRQGSRHLGVNDKTFGGNFNRIQNLMLKNGGLYLSPDFSGFGNNGFEDIRALASAYSRRSPRAKVFVACGSMGAEVCWRFANADTAHGVDGLIFLAGRPDANIMKSALTTGKRAPIPLLFSHGTADEVFSSKQIKSMFNGLRKRNPSLPARYVEFETGVHGTPLRMIDWRREINWMLRSAR